MSQNCHCGSKICSKVIPKIIPNFRFRICDVLNHIWAQIGIEFCLEFDSGRTHLAPKGPPSGPKRHQEAPRDCHGGHQGTPRGLQSVPQTFWLRLGSHFAPVWPRTNLFGPQRPSQWPQKVPRSPKGLPWGAPWEPKGSPKGPKM